MLESTPLNNNYTASIVSSQVTFILLKLTVLALCFVVDCFLYRHIDKSVGAVVVAPSLSNRLFKNSVSTQRSPQTDSLRQPAVHRSKTRQTSFGSTLNDQPTTTQWYVEPPPKRRAVCACRASNVGANNDKPTHTAHYAVKKP